MSHWVCYVAKEYTSLWMKFHLSSSSYSFNKHCCVFKKYSLRDQLPSACLPFQELSSGFSGVRCQTIIGLPCYVLAQLSSTLSYHLSMYFVLYSSSIHCFSFFPIMYDLLIYVGFSSPLISGASWFTIKAHMFVFPYKLF